MIDDEYDNLKETCNTPLHGLIIDEIINNDDDSSMNHSYNFFVQK